MSEVTIEEEIAGLEYQKAKAQEEIAFSKKVERLLLNPDFKSVILDKYITQEAARFVHVSCDVNISVENRGDALANAQAAGYLKRWLQTTQSIANLLKGDLEQIEETITDLRAEQE